MRLTIREVNLWRPPDGGREADRRSRAATVLLDAAMAGEAGGSVSPAGS